MKLMINEKKEIKIDKIKDKQKEKNIDKIKENEKKEIIIGEINDK